MRSSRSVGAAQDGEAAHVAFPVNLTIFCAASHTSFATSSFKPDSASNFRPSSAFVPCRRTTKGTLIFTSLAASMTP